MARSELDLWYEMWARAGSQGLDTWYEVWAEGKSDEDPEFVEGMEGTDGVFGGGYDGG